MENMSEPDLKMASVILIFNFSLQVQKAATEELASQSRNFENCPHCILEHVDLQGCARAG
jgi:hypothetical protein